MTENTFDSSTLGLPRPNDRLEVYQDQALEWRWRLQAGNGEIIADSAEGYVSRGGAISAAQRVFPKPAPVPVAPSVMPRPAPVLPWWAIAGLVVAFIAGVIVGWVLSQLLGDDGGDAKPISATTTTERIAPTSTTVTFETPGSGGTVITDGHTTVLVPTTAPPSPSGDPPPNSSTTRP